MTPYQLAKSDTEEAHQTAFFAWCNIARHHGFVNADNWAETGILRSDADVCSYAQYEPLKWIHAIPNGGSRGDDAKSKIIRGGQLKAQGVKQGVYDIFLPHGRGGYFGLYIEMKKPSVKPKKETSKDGRSDEQIEFANDIANEGYVMCLCYSWQDAVFVIKKYFEFLPTKGN